ncbi:unnamed protein product [Rotaria magnacalcarata]|uniref:WWE domain-containing protein n=2 Tax=Rotaria magnacalcarata TaxID=392030 RepID=A0A815YER1_9BILA|nr:unnamed protein product [Rotaria magnacalcarata]CAF4615203.1 unnamed protein product [Rotaria magnacalcarata]
MASLLSSSTSRIVWKWKSNTQPWSNVEPDTWEQYSDIENYMIENAYKKNESQVQLDHFWIDFNNQIQIKIDNPNKKRPIKREIMHRSNNDIREQRFTMEQPKLDYKSLNMTDPFRSFVQNSGCRLLSDDKINDEWIEKAAHGIETEGAKLGKMLEAQCIANELRNMKHKSKNEILECCVGLYTAESFLYKLINKVMREADMCKGMLLRVEDREYGKTLGPYCGLLEKYIHDSPKQQDITVYRCATLTNEMIHDYKENIGRLAWWDSFSSTTKNKNKAFEFGGNCLFVIYIPRGSNFSGVDISSLSEYPGEEEILLQPAIRMSIKKVEYDLNINKHIINLELSSC